MLYVSFWNQLIICLIDLCLCTFSLNTEVHKLRSMRPAISQFQKEIQNLVLIERKQVDKKTESSITIGEIYKQIKS